MPPSRLHADQVDIDEWVVRALIAAQLPQYAGLPPLVGADERTCRRPRRPGMLTVRPVEPDDLGSVAELLVELAEFYDVPAREPVATKLAHLREFLFDDPSAHLLFYRVETQVAGAS